MSRHEKVLIVDDNPADARLIKEMLLESGGGFDIDHASRLDEAMERAEDSGPEVVLLDLMLPDSRGLETFERLYGRFPGLPVVVLTGLSDEGLAARALRRGAQDYLVKGRVDPYTLSRAVRHAIERNRKSAHGEARSAGAFVEKVGDVRVVGESPAMAEVMELVATVAKTSSTSVLIRGETGTGKGLVAGAVHFLSNRKDGPFIDLNCSAIPESLLESEMFGHEKGAFTDAKHDKKGLLELADGGTIFLDEIGDMDMRLQPKLLKFLEDRTFRRVGGTRDLRVDVRVIAATNKDIRTLVRERRFREDLYYRLKVMEIDIPPLRERRGDILPLAKHFLDLYCRGSENGKKSLSRESVEVFLNYQWPGNVRELRNVIERATIVSRTPHILPEHLPEELLRETSYSDEASDSMTLAEVERSHILKVLKKSGGNKTRASRTLGISRLTLRNKLKSYGLDES